MVQGHKHFYKNTPQLWEQDNDPAGFEWIELRDSSSSVVSFLRRSKTAGKLYLSATSPRCKDRIQDGRGTVWREVLNSDSSHYEARTQEIWVRSKRKDNPTTIPIELTLPPLACLVLFLPEETD
ncbi:MAG: alpha amylase C-terminal domain-containing protein [Bacteroidales bacterium]|nr:alpha amylase C-terminal domain-containing protein [Bacteroidales bacterium]